MIVDEMHEEYPEMIQDQYWDEVVPTKLPYTVGAERYRRHEPRGSAEYVKIKASDTKYESTHKVGDDEVSV